MTFASILDYLMSFKQISHAQLCEELSLDQSALDNWLEGHDIPDKRTVRILADLFNVPTAFLAR